MKDTSLPIYETFRAFQGEGIYLGQPAFFVRTFGCPLHCPWCDSAGTWHKEWVPKNIDRVSVRTLIENAVEANPRFVVVTGGEPTIHKDGLRALVEGLHARGLRTHLETSGAFELPDIPGEALWVTLSPKWSKLPVGQAVMRADELKIIVENPSSISEWESALGGLATTGVPVWLHPEWGQRNNPAVLNAISFAVAGGVARRIDYRAGWQIHKLYKVDALDARAKQPVPLGGIEENGY